MVNLLSGGPPREPFPAFDDNQRARFEERARFSFRLDWPSHARELARAVDFLSDELEELEAEPSLVAADELLDRIDRARRALLDTVVESSSGPANPFGGEWLCYWPGRSLSTGEAEIASHGFFDARDRPPVGLWVESIGRRRSRSRSDHELAIVCWIPSGAVQRAQAGREACAESSLAYLAEVSEALDEQARMLPREVTFE